jgi:hypothetical protein
MCRTRARPPAGLGRRCWRCSGGGGGCSCEGGGPGGRVPHDLHATLLASKRARRPLRMVARVLCSADISLSEVFQQHDCTCDECAGCDDAFVCSRQLTRRPQPSHAFLFAATNAEPPGRCAVVAESYTPLQIRQIVGHRGLLSHHRRHPVMCVQPGATSTPLAFQPRRIWRASVQATSQCAVRLRFFLRSTPALTIWSRRPGSVRTADEQRSTGLQGVA